MSSIQNTYLYSKSIKVEESTIEDIINEHQLNRVYKSKTFELYSLKNNYNPTANVFFYVKGSKKAKIMLEYNLLERKAEVLYQYGTKFITKECYTKNGKYYFLLKEL